MRDGILICAISVWCLLATIAMARWTHLNYFSCMVAGFFAPVMGIFIVCLIYTAFTFPDSGLYFFALGWFYIVTNSVTLVASGFIGALIAYFAKPFLRPEPS